MENFINKSFENNISKLIIVTGKGLHSSNANDPYVSKNYSILKYSVPEFIKKSQELMMKIYDIKDADIIDGGDGAFYIFLKKNNLFNDYKIFITRTSKRTNTTYTYILIFR